MLSGSSEEGGRGRDALVSVCVCVCVHACVVCMSV